MGLQLDACNLKQGLLGLVITLVEIIRDLLAREAVKRMKGGRLSEAEAERLGVALMDLDRAIEELKDQHGLHEVVRQTRQALDDLVDDVLSGLAEPERWEER